MNGPWDETSPAYKPIKARERLEVEMCQAWLRFLLRDGPCRVLVLWDEVYENLGVSAAIMDRAGEALGLVESYVEGRRYWSLPADS